MTDPMADRRRNERLNIHLPVKWYGMAGIQEARLGDLSLGGCFVDTAAHIELDEEVSLEVQLPSGDWLPLRGKVAYCQTGIGFGLVFTFLTEQEKKALKDLITEK
jgi:Tfp pilus assembly protein PilZ